MSKEKKVRNHKVLNHPIAALFLLMFWGLAFYQAIGEILGLALGEAYSGYAAALGAILALVIHKAWFSPEFKGSVRKPEFRAKDIKFVFLGFAAAIIIIDLTGFIGQGVAFTMANLGLALMAGIGEEMFVRVLPISVMMRDWMDEKHVPVAAYSTSILFGLIHFTNIGGGASVRDTIVQVILATGLGAMFAAVYLRTGNILFSMVLHTIHDMLAFSVVGATNSSGVILGMSAVDVTISTLVGIISLAVSTYLIRKSVRADIVTVWKERWSQE